MTANRCEVYVPCPTKKKNFVVDDTVTEGSFSSAARATNFKLQRKWGMACHEILV